MKSNEYYMNEAILEAKKAKDIGEVPVGCIIVNPTGEIIARAHNLIENSKNVAAHAEILAIKKACKQIDNWRLSSHKLFVTLEPCIMCSGALVLSRISEIYFGCHDIRFGGAGSAINICNNEKLPHLISVNGGILKDECLALIQDFFKEVRINKK